LEAEEVSDAGKERDAKLGELDQKLHTLTCKLEENMKLMEDIREQARHIK